ncbi:TonB-dependent receptor family protein [Nitrospina sp. 32_T5]|uniref:TonB-dependent receptor family protein n=1 Tax=Nitrospina sp. TaxID=2024844 RepID=UPI003FC1D69A
MDSRLKFVIPFFINAVLSLFLFAPAAFAESKEIVLKEIEVVGKKEKPKGTLTVPSNAEAEKEIKKAPGGVNVVTEESFEDTYTLNFEDTLALVPGAYAQKRFGEEVRLSLRGSGLARGFHLVGLRLLQDGIPFNLADGSGDFQEMDFLALQRIEVYKGGNALQYGGITLGGAVNLITKNGKSHPGQMYRFDGGADQTFRLHLQSGYQFNRSDLFVSVTATTSDDFRDHARQENVKFNSNYGLRLSDSVETRFYMSTNVIAQELPGTVTLGQALSNPENANPSAITQDWQRDINSVRLSNKTTFDLGNGRFVDVGAYVNHKTLFHPITSFVGIIDQTSLDYGVFAQAHGSYSLSGYKNEFRGGVLSQFGYTNALVFQNFGGARGALTSDQDQSAETVVLYGENHFYFNPQWALVTGGQVIYAGRESENKLAPAQSDSQTTATFNPRVGVMYHHTPTIQFFANVTRSYEPPDFSNLTQGGAAGFAPLSAQKAWTVEVGSRGQHGRVAWDIALYRAWVEDELLQFTTGPGFPVSTFNADSTIHQGVEAGLDILLARNLLQGGDRLQWRNAYTYSDFKFDDNVQHGDNTLPGQPPHFYQAELRYTDGDKWFVAPTLEAASSAYVDFSNRLKAPGYAILGFTAGYTVNKNIDVFANGRNLLDKNFISTFSTIATPTPFNQAAFYAGDDRRIFGGVRLRF